MAKRRTTAAKSPATTASNKTTSTTEKKPKKKEKSPLQKAVTAALASGKAKERAATKHNANLAALKKLEEGK